MKASLFAFIFLIACLALAPKASAQIPVIDSANLAQNLQTATQAVVEVEQLKAQLAELENDLRDVHQPDSHHEHGTRPGESSHRESHAAYKQHRRACQRNNFRRRGRVDLLYSKPRLHPDRRLSAEHNAQ